MFAFPNVPVPINIFLFPPSNVIPFCPTLRISLIYPALPAKTGEEIERDVINVPLPATHPPFAKRVIEELASVFAVWIAAACAAEADAEPDVTAFVPIPTANNSDAVRAAAAEAEPDVTAFAPAVVATREPLTTAFAVSLKVAALPPVILIAPFIVNTPPAQLSESPPGPLK